MFSAPLCACIIRNKDSNSSITLKLIRKNLCPHPPTPQVSVFLSKQHKVNETFVRAEVVIMMSSMSRPASLQMFSKIIPIIFLDRDNEEREREEAPHQGQASIIIIVLIWKLHSLLRSASSRPVSLESQPPSQHSTSLAMVTILSSVSTLVTILQINPESQMRMVLCSEVLWLHTKRLSENYCENSFGLNTAIG